MNLYTLYKSVYVECLPYPELTERLIDVQYGMMYCIVFLGRVISRDVAERC